MSLVPEARALLDQMAEAGGAPLSEMSPAAARELSAGFAQLAGEKEDVGKVEDLQVPVPGGSILVRIYTPRGGGPFPLLVYYHGGGWVIGDVEQYDAVTRQLCNVTGCGVASVDYRLAPEHKYPTASEDSYAALVYLAEHAPALNLSAGKIAVAGDSAGGHLSAVVAQMARDRNGPSIGFQALLYPVTDYNLDTESYQTNAEGYLLEKASMIWFWDHYLRSAADGQEAYASPLKAKSLKGLPPALVITAEYDPLRDEGNAYARRLEEDGVETTLSLYRGLIHGFFQMPAVFPQAREAMEEIASHLRRTFKS